MLEASTAVSRPSYEQVASRIATMIQQECLAPGAKLQTERQLGARFKVSRNTVREALKVLSTAGLVRVRQGSGVYVTSPTQPFASAHITLDMSVDPEHIFSLLEFRLGLEQQTARLAAERITPRELRALEDTLLQHQAAAQARDGESFHRMDLAFHATVAEATHNPFLLSAVQTTTQLHSWAIVSSLTVTPGSLLAASAQHQKVFEAISRGEPEQAVAFMTEHLESLKLSYQQEVRRRLA